MSIRALSLFGISFLSLWAAGSGPVAADAGPTTPYRLTVADDRISLEATDASVVALVEKLGRALGFEVVAEGVDDARVSARFEGLSPRDAIREICKSVTYVEIPDPETDRTTRLVLIPRKLSAANRAAASRETFNPRSQLRTAAPVLDEPDAPAAAEAEEEVEDPD